MINVPDDTIWIDSTWARIGRFTGNGQSFIVKVTRLKIDSELRFYDENRWPDRPVPACFDKGWTDDGYFLVLEDLSGSHVGGHLVEIDDRYASDLGTALGRLHHGRVTKCAASSPNLYLAHVDKGLEELGDPWGQSLLTALREQMQHRELFGEVHGDVNPTNVLYRPGDTRIIDRQPFEWSLTHWSLAADLALAIIPYWPIEDRVRYEQVAIEAFVRASGFDEALVRRDYELAKWLTVLIVADWLIDANRQGMKWLWEAQWQRFLSSIGR